MDLGGQRVVSDSVKYTRRDHQIGYSQRNARGTEDISPHDLGAGFSWEGNEENDESHQPPTRRDPLVDSIRTLDYVREALEKELLKFKEIGMCYNSFADTVNSFDYMNGEDLSQSAHGFIDLAEKITYLESKLEESSDAIKMKELEVGNLEASLRLASLHNGDMNNKSLEQEKTGKLELELEILFAQRVEGDVKYIATANALEDAKHAVAKSETLLIDQKALEEEHLPVRTRLGLNECKVGKIKRHAKDLERAVTAGSISKLTWYSLSQLLMLLGNSLGSIFADNI